MLAWASGYLSGKEDHVNAVRLKLRDFPLFFIETIEGFDHSGKTAYIEACQRSNVVPVSYYLRHMHDSQLRLCHHQLGSGAIKPIAVSLVVRVRAVCLQ